MKKMIAVSLACLMVVSPIMAAEAEIPAITVPDVGDQEAHKGENNVPVTLDVLRQNKPIVTFSVTVPTSLPLVMDLSGNVKTATNAQVKNNSTEDVVVTDVNITAADGWTLAAYDSALKERPADTKELGMEINTCKTNTENLLFDQEKFPTVKAKGMMPVTYNALLPRQKTAGSVGTVANSVFVIGWADPTVDEPLEKPIPDPHGDIPIDSSHFPDPELRRALKECPYYWNNDKGDGIIDANKDGILQEAERGKVEFFDLTSSQNYKITDISGIEYFPNLIGIDTDQSYLTSIDLSRNPKFIHDYDQSRGKDHPDVYYWGYWDRQQTTPYPLPIPNTGTLDLSTIPGNFDPQKAINFTGCTREGNIITFDTSKKEKISYEYEAGCPDLEAKCSQKGYVKFYFQPTDGAVLPVF